ncbi:DUF2924 domain-containing protein [Corallococcus sp. M34]|uniref:DUF2924 domain-containing protein n=1 Tax=Citreicoccus inhibens TaxID=2849499 RepID=UPI001C230272|nr:DUF2924 domain-containing protein [Citreicoccus inhibens]MBU8901038.1 DUF2924 domain-containing protein [Citreicoccus inhibens]
MPRNTAPKKLESMSLTELRARYREVVGEETRSPNKKHLIRRIEESLAEKKRRSPVRPGAATAPSTPPPTPAAQATPSPGEAAPSPRTRGRFGALSLPELQVEYRKVLGRPTSSTNTNYLKWKIREAEAGRVSVGPRPEREAKASKNGKRVIPLSMDAEAVKLLDKVWRDAGLPSRTHFFMRATHRELKAMGATEAAALFAPEET